MSEGIDKGIVVVISESEEIDTGRVDITFKKDESDIGPLKSHSSRKMRLYPRSSQEPENSAIFYYYYISTNKEAYVKRLRLKDSKTELMDLGHFKIMINRI